MIFYVYPSRVATKQHAFATISSPIKKPKICLSLLISHIFKFLLLYMKKNRAMDEIKKHQYSVLLCFFFILSHFFLQFKPVSAQTSAVFACDTANNPSLKSFPFCDVSLGVSDRVNDLVKRLTLQEKISMLVNTAGSVSRLGIPKYEWWSEALHGISYTGPGVKFNNIVPHATSFPQPILTSASFNETLFQTIGKVIPFSSLYV